MQDDFNAALQGLPPADAAHQTIKQAVQMQDFNSFVFIGKREGWHIEIHPMWISFRTLNTRIAKCFQFYYLVDINFIDNIWLTQEDIIKHIFNQ